jgi:hypothetical protein
MRRNSLESPKDAIEKLIKNAKGLDEIIRNLNEKKAKLEDILLDAGKKREMLSEIEGSLKGARRSRIEKAVPDLLHTINREEDPEAYKAAFKKLLLDRKRFSEDETMYRYKLRSHPDGYPANDPVKAEENAKKFAYSEEEKKLLLIASMIKPNSRGNAYSYHDAIRESGIKEKPISYHPTNLQKKYILAYWREKEDVIVFNISDELRKIETPEQRQELEADPRKIAELQKLSIVAKIYTQYADVFALAKSLD